MRLQKPAAVFQMMVDLVAPGVPGASGSELMWSLRQAVSRTWRRGLVPDGCGRIPTTLSPAQGRGLLQGFGLAVLRLE